MVEENPQRKRRFLVAWIRNQQKTRGLEFIATLKRSGGLPDESKVSLLSPETCADNENMLESVRQRSSTRYSLVDLTEGGFEQVCAAICSSEFGTASHLWLLLWRWFPQFQLDVPAAALSPELIAKLLQLDGDGIGIIAPGWTNAFFADAYAGIHDDVLRYEAGGLGSVVPTLQSLKDEVERNPEI